MYEYRDIAMRPSTILTTVDETVRAVADICRARDSRAWLFGSQARQRARCGSDIDVAVLSDDFDTIEEEVEALDTIFPIDLVDLTLPHERGIENAWVSIA